MNKRIRLLLIAVLAVICTVCLVACGRPKNEQYVAYEITDVRVTQKGARSYDIVMTCDIPAGSGASVYVTHYDRITEKDKPIEYTAVDGKYVFSANISYSSCYFYVVDGDKLAVLPFTRPQMAPSLTADKTAGQNVLTYNFVNGTSWSSFCDPTGKAVYKSSNHVFDETAQVVAKNVNIFGVDNTTDLSPDESMPYYYVVLSAKNGIVTYVSAPLMTLEKAYKDVKVSLATEDGKPMLKVEGKFVVDGDVAVELYSADTKLGRVVEVVGDSVSGKADDEFVVSVDASQILNGTKGAGIWFDIKLARSVGSLYELPATAAKSQTLKYQTAEFNFKVWNNILKLNYDVNDYDIESMVIKTVSGVPTLVIKGTTSDDVVKVRLHADVVFDASSGKSAESFYWNNSSKQSGAFEFSVPLTDLPYEGTPWCWFHLYTTKQGKQEESSDLNRSANIKIGEEYKYGNVTYTIKAYEGVGTQLAIQPVGAGDYAVTSVNIETLNGAPTLVVKGTVKAGVKIRVRAEVVFDANSGKSNELLYWNNSSEQSGVFEIYVPLTDLPYEGTPWCWFHILIGDGDNNKYNLERDSNIAYQQQFVYDGVKYTVQAYSNVSTEKQLVIQPVKQ